MRLEWRRRPLFYAALVLSSTLAIFPPHEKNTLGPEGSAFLGGRIVSETESREVFHGARKDYFILKVEKRWDGLENAAQDVQGRVRVSWKNPPAGGQARPEYGDVIVLEGELASFPGRRNPGGFDSKAYWERQKVHAAFYVPKNARYKLLAHGQGNPIKAAAIAARRYLSDRLSKDFNEEQGAFLKALFLGERSDMDQDFRDLFLNTGTMHILAVSGFNIGFLSAVLWLLLKPFPLHRNLKLSLTLIAVWAYCLLVGWQAPVVRATLMATVFLLGEMMGRKSDGLNALGLAACVILALNPLQLFDVGFQLSFLAVFGLIVFSPQFVKREKLPHEVWTWEEKISFSVRELFWVSFVCYFLTLPIVLQNFYIVTPYAMLANLVVVPLGFLLFLFAVPYFLIPGAAGLMKFTIAFFTRSLFMIEQLPGAVWVTGKLAWPLTILLGAGIFYLFSTKRFKHPRFRAEVIVLFCVGIFLAQEAVRFCTRHFEMTVLDVGQGDSIYFEFPDGRNLLVDGGEGRFSDKGKWVVEPFLRSKGVRSIDAVVISHPQEDHVGGLSTVFKDFKVERAIHAGTPYDTRRWKYLQKEMSAKTRSIHIVKRGEEISGFPGERILVLHPNADDPSNRDVNDASVVLKVIHGKASFLLTGDIQQKAMRSLLDSGEDLRADVLKVPHHGGKTGASGEEFFKAVSPRISLISAGARNPFGHPAPQTVTALEAVPGNQVLRTDRSGALRIRLDGASGLPYIQKHD